MMMMMMMIKRNLSISSEYLDYLEYSKSYKENLSIVVYNENSFYKKLVSILRNEKFFVCELEFNYFYKDKIELDLKSAGNLKSIKDNYLKILKIIESLREIEKKGYLNELNIKDLSVISKFVKFFTKDLSWIKGKNSYESFKWIFNVLIVNLYYLAINNENLLEKIGEKESDFYIDNKNLINILYTKLDPSIRFNLQKRSITMIKNIYVGFDSEYVSINTKYNKLLSVQLAVNSRILLKIPKITEYFVSSIDPLTNKKYDITYSKGFDFNIVNNSISYCIEKIKMLKPQLKYHEKTLTVLTDGLKKVKNVQFFEKDDFYIFSFPRNPTKTFIYIDNKELGYTLKEVLYQSDKISEEYLEFSYNKIISILKNIFTGNDLQNIDYFDFIDKEIKSKVEITNKLNDLKGIKDSKYLERQYMTGFSVDRISVTKIKNFYLVSHLTNADLSMLKDFDSIKEYLNIVNKSFITLGKPIHFNGYNLVIRDTMLLTPANHRSLEKLGSLYGSDFNKISISLKDKENMDEFLKKNPNKFIEYALKDAEIPLIHANFMEDFNFKIHELGIPVTLSSLSSKYVKFKWIEKLYDGYQISNKYLIGDTSVTQTPKGLNILKDIGLNINRFIACYKGGRNECFMYGIDENTLWFDYDLTTAYTTILSVAGHPEYNQGRFITIEELEKMSDEEIIFSYIAIKADFEFNSNVKFPSLACFIDENTSVYPLKGSCHFTGPEYILARNQNCKFKINEIYYLPFSKSTTSLLNENENENENEFNYIKPFMEIILELQKLRRKYSKGHILNTLYKEILNSIYGNIVKGMSDKKKFDIKTRKNLRIEGTEFSNPIIASWTTGFIRSIIGECLHNINGLVVSVTTDGFITNVDKLEDKLQENILFKYFKKIRFLLSGDSNGLELKNSGEGIISWNTRGQLGIKSSIKATTGYQTKNINHYELVKKFLEVFKSDKNLEYIQTTLRSAKDIFKSGGHVTKLFQDQVYRLLYDNRRLIIDSKNKDTNTFELLDSKPLKDITEGANLRNTSRFLHTIFYNRRTHKVVTAKYKNYIELAVRNFIKMLLLDPNKLNIKNDFKNYNEIIDYLKKFYPKLKISKSSISHLKNRKVIEKSVPKTKETLEFVAFLKTRFKNFHENNFFN
jgi:hypothetical protein